MIYVSCDAQSKEEVKNQLNPNFEFTDRNGVSHYVSSSKEVTVTLREIPGVTIRVYEDLP